MNRTLPLVTMIATLALCAAPAAAQTPDGETPAVETVCDPLRSATPGLYGLCVAYCEAHDADLDPNSFEPSDTSVASEKILENYNRRKTASDPEMPCLRVPCPCFDAVDLAGLHLDRCDESTQGVFLRGSTCGRLPDLANAFAAGGIGCRYQDTDSATCKPLTATTLFITPDEFIACRDLLFAEAALRGITCL